MSPSCQPCLEELHAGTGREHGGRFCLGKTLIYIHIQYKFFDGHRVNHIINGGSRERCVMFCLTGRKKALQRAQWPLKIFCEKLNRVHGFLLILCF